MAIAQKYKNWIVEPLITGTVVIVGTPFVGGLLNSVLSFIPSTSIGGILVPHTLVAATLSAIVGNMAANFVSKKI